MNALQQPFGLILAGGQGRRMGGVAKAGLRLGGERLLARADARLAPQVDRVVVSANAAVETSLPVVPDAQPGFLGPLAGVLAGLTWVTERGGTHMVSVAVDTPFFPGDLTPQLLLAGDGGLAVAATSDGAHGTFGLWPVSLRPALETFLADGGRKVRAFTDSMGAATARFPDTTPPQFFNINTPQDLAQAEAWL